MLLYVHRDRTRTIRSFVQCCFTSTETVQGLLGVLVQCCFTFTETVQGLLGTGRAQNVPFNVHTAEFKFNVALRPQRPYQDY